MMMSPDLAAGRFLRRIFPGPEKAMGGTKMSALAFLARPRVGDNPENIIPAGFFCAASSDTEKAPPEVLLRRGLETFSVRARIVSLAVSVSFSSLPFSLLP